MKRSIVHGHIGTPGGDLFVALGSEWPDDHVVVVANPALFEDVQADPPSKARSSRQTRGAGQ